MPAALSKSGSSSSCSSHRTRVAIALEDGLPDFDVHGRRVKRCGLCMCYSHSPSPLKKALESLQGFAVIGNLIFSLHDFIKSANYYIPYIPLVKTIGSPIRLRTPGRVSFHTINHLIIRCRVRLASNYSQRPGSTFSSTA